MISSPYAKFIRPMMLKSRASPSAITAKRLPKAIASMRYWIAVAIATQMIDRKLIGKCGTAGWRSIPSPETTLVPRPYQGVRARQDRGLMLGLARPRRHHTFRSTI